MTINLEGCVFGRLTVIRETSPKTYPTGKQRVWFCKCTCGGTKEVPQNSLRRGTTTSCGCYQRERTVIVNTKHNLCDNALYATWACMKSRCCNPNNEGYHNYGGRGIKVCDRWLESFENFYEDMGDKPSKDHSLDRIDNDGDYCPENCRWATWEEQGRNRKTNKVYTLHGETHCLKEWCDIYNIKYHVVRSRVLSGWPIETALTKPVNKYTKEMNGGN